MKFLIPTLSILASVLLLSLSPVALAASSSAATHNDSNVYLFSDLSTVSGASSQLVRRDNSVSMTIHTSNLLAGHVVTVWWVIFNKPENCKHGELNFKCGAGDLPPFGGDDSAQTSVLYAAGHVVGGSGDASYGAYLIVGNTAGALFGPGLTYARGAHIHLVVHDHGVIDPSSIADAIHRFGPCTLPPGTACKDLQFAVHEN